MVSRSSLDIAEKALPPIAELPRICSDESATLSPKDEVYNYGRGRKAALLSLFCLSMFIDGQ